MHIPPVKGLKKVVLNGKAVRWDGKSGKIDVK
jgi:hypothetical protein